MLELQRLRDDKELAIELLQVRGEDARERIDQILEVDAKRRSTQHTHDEQQAEMNRLSKEIGVLFKSGKREEAEAMRAKTGELKDGSHELKTQLHDLGEELTQLLYHVPNIPNPLVPAGKSDADNQIIDEEGSIPQLPEGSVPHWDLTEKYNLIDFELGVKVTGAGFPIYRGKGAKLQRALINFFLDQATEAGYEEVIPPLLVNEASGYGTGQLPDKEGQMYQTAVDNLYLIPTGEVPITNIFRDVVLKEADLPQKCVGHTPCFRREAGSYGKDVRGLNRLHQFDKVEIVQVVDPATSYDVLDTMVDHVKALLRKLELPFRVTRLCGGDLGYTAALTYDLEVYSAAQEKWLEVSSVSNFETYQSNRLKARIKGAEGKTHLAHTLNGSALALPRIMAALLENHQTAEGIRIPKALVPYTGFDVID
jgi:seryl-tRNA synthetase